MKHTQVVNPIYCATRVPVIQNKVYSNPEHAINAPTGNLEIVQSQDIGYYYNAQFDPEIIEYDQAYDNSVPSQTFLNYYDQISDYLVERYDLKRGKIIEIGCGKAAFLSRMSSRYEYIRGIGVDPSYEGPSALADGRLTFIKEEIRADHLRTHESVALVICRHVLEHIPAPVEFLGSIFDSLKKAENLPIFLEVPDLTWIIDQRAFWDFCYEHVNYFDPVSLARCISKAGARVDRVSSSFGGQYLWALATLNPRSAELDTKSENAERAFSFDLGHREIDQNIVKSDFDDVLMRTIGVVEQLSKTRKTVVWGMATKGVMYTLYLQKSGVRIDYCVDINEKKQNKFSPVSGVEIVSPSSLDHGLKYAIICMNSNYAGEVESQCESLNLDVVLFLPESMYSTGCIDE